MKHKILITALIAIGLSLSGGAHALQIWKPDGTKTQAQVAGNKLMLQDAKGKLRPAGDGVYKSSDGKSFVVKGGIIVPGGGSPAAFPIDPEVNKGKVIGPIDNKGKILPYIENKGTPGGISVPLDNKGKFTATPNPAIQGPAKALPMPQGTQGSRPLLPGSPKDPSGPAGPGGFAPPPK